VRGRLAAAIAGLALVGPAVGVASVDPFGGGNPNELELAMERLAERGLPVYCGGGRKPLVALTFDDGPGPYTPELLRVLRRGHARATFFDVGTRLETWRSAAIAQAHTGFVGNHTWNHRWLAGLRPDAIRTQVERTQRAAAQQLGRHLFLFRPPYGMRDRVVDRIARRHRLLDVMWSVDSEDSKPYASPQAAVANVGTRVRPGSIVLLHDLHAWTPRVAARVLRVLHRRHLRAVSVPELLAADPPRWTSGGRPRDDCR
jgi:peptidoglycan/xylan/chitin deacetylase (PgdA/CDA1 family)